MLRQMHRYHWPEIMQYGRFASGFPDIPDEWAEIKSYYIITRETLTHKSIYDYLTRMMTVDDILNVNAPKAPWEAKI